MRKKKIKPSRALLKKLRESNGWTKKETIFDEGLGREFVTHSGIRSKREMIPFESGRNLQHNEQGEYEVMQWAGSSRMKLFDDDDDDDHLISHSSSFFNGTMSDDENESEMKAEEREFIQKVREKCFTRWLFSIGGDEDFFSSSKWKKRSNSQKVSFYSEVYNSATKEQIEAYDEADRKVEENPGWNPTLGRSHFTMTITAMRKSGKSTLIERLLSDYLVKKDSPVQFFQHKVLIKPTAFKDSTIQKEHFDEIICGDDADGNGNTGASNYINDKIQELMLREGKVRTLIVMDDILGEIGHTGNHLINRFTTRNRHHNTSVIIATQNFKSISPTIRNNTSIWIIFRVVNTDEFSKMRKELEAVNQIYHKIDFRNPFTYMLITVEPGPRVLVYEGMHKFIGEVE